MAMVVKNNMSAVNTLNVLNANSAALAKDLQHVATGMKVNSAADDNSGYAISERMQVRMRALEQADQNTQNGANMLKVAEGAVSSTVDILRSMKEKAINAANDSNTDQDRATIQKEIDQSIDQIDDNALITYNGKTLVDGSKMAKGEATRTSLTNQSLHESTDSSTKLVDLKNRNGERLNIQTTDTLTVSYVVQGRVYTKDIDIDANTTLTNVLTEAAKPYTADSPGGRAAYSTYYYEEAVANSTYRVEEYGANSTYNSAYQHASTTYQGQSVNLSEALVQARNDSNDAYAAYRSAAREFADEHITEAEFDAARNVWKGASTQYYNISTNNSQQLSTFGSIYASTTASANTVRCTAIEAASQACSTAISIAASTMQDHLGDLFPYNLVAESGNVVGKAASGDTVYTANREKAITITSASPGVRYQLSGLTFSVQDSGGKVKKSVNAVLDNFTESVRAVNKSNDNAINLQIDAKANQTIRISLTDMRSEALGLKSSSGETISISTQKHANAVVNVLDNAIQKALDQQTDIGAVANRMEQTSNNLHIARDNVQASESTIRDADMAKAMTSYTKNNILLQAAQSMLAQANQSSSNVLSLLQ